MSPSDDPISSIFFERQQAALCAQHALNMLLQDSLFTYENLRDLARQMDQMEHDILGNNANAVGRSENMNDSGFFSIQVIEKALETFDLKLINMENPAMAEFKANPLTARAYVLNLREHWFVLRKFGNQWFELNSVKNGPKLLTDTYVKEYLHQFAAENYSIFVVQGILPNSEADDFITLCPVVPKPTDFDKKEPNLAQKFFNSVGRRLGGSQEIPDSQEDRDLAIAMALSMESKESSESSGSDEDQLAKAIEMSLSQDPNIPSTSAAPSELTETPILGPSTSSETPSGRIPSAEQQRRDRAKFLEKLEEEKKSQNVPEE
ncbi:hypothetical protein L5515_009581 [Caenorhabditis briggsae]|uniref:Ataxin-3 homolog n=2 Tax=Caenorhabditis briggsae TaxID=6238 RepID=A0AAE9FC01_CAEBR|nr:hypothetical protein L5515_009581 [Caenorhabditis briggsae]